MIEERRFLVASIGDESGRCEEKEKEGEDVNGVLVREVHNKQEAEEAEEEEAKKKSKNWLLNLLLGSGRDNNDM